LELSQSALSGLKAEIKTAEGELKTAEESSLTAEKQLNDKLSESEFDSLDSAEKALRSDSLRRALLRDTTTYVTLLDKNAEDLKAKQSELQDKAEPDSSRFADRLEAIDSENEKYICEKTDCAGRTSALRKKQANLAGKEKRYNAEIVQAADDLSFAKKLRGDKGLGIQRYVLAIMFGQVINEANSMLRRVHGGRYHLIRTDEGGSGSKRGLELKVHDSRSPESEGRSVKMLSGGEKFLVSLALSIGMSTIAQKTGVRIEALFIDEGFGTLDDSSIGDAMQVLESVRIGNGLIGIISHVQLLESTIDSQLEIVKDNGGNYIRRV